MSGFADVANARYKVGQGDQRNVLRAQVEILKLVDRKTDIEQRIVAAVSRINGLLNHKPGSPVGKPGDVQKSELPYTLEELVRLAVDNAPALKKRQGEIARGTHAVDLAVKDYYPDFTVGFNYIDRDNMREMYGLMVKGTVPLYFWRKQRPALESARLKLESVRKENENDIAAIGAEVEEAYSAVKSADEIMELYRSSLVPQTGLTLEAAFAAYQVGNEDLRELLTSVSVLLDAQLRYYEALADHQKALARLEPLVGFELTK
jgi:outer membrane protein TolC